MLTRPPLGTVYDYRDRRRRGDRGRFRTSEVSVARDARSSSSAATMSSSTRNSSSPISCTLFCAEPAAAGLQGSGARCRRDERLHAAGLKDFEGGIVDIGHDGDGFAFDSEGPRHRELVEPFRLADRDRSPMRRVGRIHRRRRLSAILCFGSPRVGQRSRAKSWTGAALLGGGGRQEFWTMTLRGLQPIGPCRSGRPCELFRGRRLCHLGRPASPHGSRMGMGGARRFRAAGNFIEFGSLAPETRIRCERRLASDVRRRLGMDAAARSRPIRGSGPSKAPSVSTTASSCPASSCCAADPA